MNSVEIKIEGLEGIEKKLKQLPANYAKRGIKRAIRKGANVIRNDARANAKQLDNSRTNNAIWKNIVVIGSSAKREKRLGGPAMRIGVLGGARNMSKYGEIQTGRSGKGNPGGDTWYWRLVEFGTVNTRAKPFMRNAIASGAEKALNVTAAAAQVELDKEISKLNVL